MFTIKAGADADVLSDEDRRETATTTALRPISPLRLAAAHARAALGSPRAYVRTLQKAIRLRTPGPRGTLWQAFYFVQAIVLAAECRRRQIAHVHAHHADVASDVALLAAEYGRQSGSQLPRSWSLTLHGPTEFFDAPRFRPGPKAEDASLVVCISDHSRGQLMAMTAPRHWERFQVVRLGVDPAAIPYVQPQAGAGPLRVLNVARMVGPKGHGILLEALAQLDRDGIGFHATLVGDGPDRSRIERLARELGLAGKVEFPGALPADRTLALYAQADAFCLPSFAEGLPVVLMEALAAGVPAVASRTAGTPELVEDGRTGLLVSPGRADQTAAALTRLAREPALREQLASAGRKRVEAEYDLRANVRRLHDLLAAQVSG
jgi:glycosyltransferase involved in cell wall biosynthesis